MNKEHDPRLRRVNAADMKAFDEEFPPELYVKWDGTGPTERLQWAATCLFESGRRVFHLDDNGSILLVDAEGNSVLGASELYVPQERMYFVALSCNAGWRLATALAYPEIMTREAAESLLDRLKTSYPDNKYYLAEVTIEQV